MQTSFKEIRDSFAGGAQVATNPQLLQVFCNPKLTRHRVYFWAWLETSLASNVTQDYGMTGRIIANDGAGSILGEIPWAVGVSAPNGQSAFSSSLASFVNSGGAPVADTMSLVLSNPVGNQPTGGILLQPFNITVPAVNFTVTLDRVLNCNNLRCFLAVVSY